MSCSSDAADDRNSVLVITSSRDEAMKNKAGLALPPFMYASTACCSKRSLATSMADWRISRVSAARSCRQRTFSTSSAAASYASAATWNSDLADRQASQAPAEVAQARSTWVLVTPRAGPAGVKAPTRTRTMSKGTRRRENRPDIAHQGTKRSAGNSILPVSAGSGQQAGGCHIRGQRASEMRG